jgi:hypothetical protein
MTPRPSAQHKECVQCKKAITGRSRAAVTWAKMPCVICNASYLYFRPSRPPHPGWKPSESAPEPRCARRCSTQRNKVRITSRAAKAAANSDEIRHELEDGLRMCRKGVEGAMHEPGVRTPVVRRFVAGARGALDALDPPPPVRRALQSLPRPAGARGGGVTSR